MNQLNPESLLESMLKAFAQSLETQWGDIKTYAETELKKLVHTFVELEEMQAVDKVSHEQAKHYLAVQKDAAEAVLLTVRGLTRTAINNAMNDAFTSVKTIVNKALGWMLL